MKLLLIVLTLVAYNNVCAYLTATTASSCLTYESSSTYKWCRYLNTLDSGYACTSSDTSSFCGYSSSYRCSNQTSYLPVNSKKLLCPKDTTSCNTQYYTLSTSTSYSNAYSSNFGNSTICWYLFSPSSSSIKSVKISINYLLYSTAEVYLETSTNVFSYQGSVLSGNTLSFNIGTYNNVWVLIIPKYSTSSSYVTITATASPNSISSSSSGVNVNETLALVCGLILCFFTLAVIIALITMTCMKKCARQNPPPPNAAPIPPALAVIYQPLHAAVNYQQLPAPLAANNAPAPIILNNGHLNGIELQNPEDPVIIEGDEIIPNEM